MSTAHRVLRRLEHPEEGDDFHDVREVMEGLEKGNPKAVRDYFFGGVRQKIDASEPRGRMISFAERKAFEGALRAAARASIQGSYDDARKQLDKAEALLFDRYSWSGEGDENLNEQVFTIAQLVSESLENLSDIYSEELRANPEDAGLADQRLREFEGYLRKHIGDIKVRERHSDDFKWLWEKIVEMSLEENADEYNEIIHAVADHLYTKIVPEHALRKVAVSAPYDYYEEIGEEISVIGDAYRHESTAGVRDAYRRLHDSVTKFNKVVDTDVRPAVVAYLHEILESVKLGEPTGDKFHKAKRKFQAYMTGVLEKYSYRLG